MSYKIKKQHKKTGHQSGSANDSAITLTHLDKAHSQIPTRVSKSHGFPPIGIFDHMPEVQILGHLPSDLFGDDIDAP